MNEHVTIKNLTVGIIEEYEYVPFSDEYVQQRKVKWLKHLPRTVFSQGALYEVGLALSFFIVKNYADEFLAAIDKNFVTESVEEDETVAAAADAIIESTPIIRGINDIELVELILKHYDRLSEKYRKMIPLKMVYIPVAKEDAE